MLINRFVTLTAPSDPQPSPTHPTVPPGTPVPEPSSPITESPTCKHDCNNLHSTLSPPTPIHSSSPCNCDNDTASILPRRPHTTVHAEVESKLRTVLNPFHISLILENRGSVARDHLALERTYLAYVRTSLAIASAGVALVQLFSVSGDGAGFQVTGSSVARPLGSAMVVYSLIVLVIGAFRYFRVQHTLPRGVFPTSLHGIAMLSFILSAFITVVFALLVGSKT